MITLNVLGGIILKKVLLIASIFILMNVLSFSQSQYSIKIDGNSITELENSINYNNQNLYNLEDFGNFFDDDFSIFKNSETSYNYVVYGEILNFDISKEKTNDIFNLNGIPYIEKTYMEKLFSLKITEGDLNEIDITSIPYKFKNEDLKEYALEYLGKESNQVIYLRDLPKIKSVELKIGNKYNQNFSDLNDLNWLEELIVFEDEEISNKLNIGSKELNTPNLKTLTIKNSKDNSDFIFPENMPPRESSLLEPVTL